jgi:hypothetical protein
MVLTSRQNLGYGLNAFNGATDLFLTCLPAVMLSNLRMKRRTKVYLSFLLGLSLLYVFYREFVVLWSLRRIFYSAFVAGVLKIVYLAALVNRGDYLCMCSQASGIINTDQNLRQCGTTIHLGRVRAHRLRQLYSFIYANLLRSIEGTFIIIAASVPLLRPLFRRKHQKQNLPSYDLRPYHHASGNASNTLNKFSIGSMSKQHDTTSDSEGATPLRTAITYVSEDS